VVVEKTRYEKLKRAVTPFIINELVDLFLVCFQL